MFNNFNFLFIFYTFGKVKIIVSIFFSIFYLFSTSGISLNIHYCGNKIKHISFIKSNDINCCGKKKMKKNCCKDKSSYFQVKDSHESGNIISSSPKINKLADFLTPIYNFNFGVSKVNFKILNYHAPPIACSNPIYILHRILLI